MTQLLSVDDPLMLPVPISSTTDCRVIWVVSLSSEDDLPSLIGDARTIADRSSSSVAVLRFLSSASGAGIREPEDWISHGADEVHLLNEPSGNQSLRITEAQRLWKQQSPWLVVTSADRVGRAWSARLSAVTGWTLVSPALLVQWKSQRLWATHLDGTGRRAKNVELPEQTPSIVALRPGVAQSLPKDLSRRGRVSECEAECEAERATENRVLSVERVPADPGTADIRHLTRLIAGGKGIGSRAGFDQLRKVAQLIGAGVASSRVAVDLGWIEYERQVGQTGKTVTPELYIACGISGASHHLEGMSESRHIIAINTDPQAPLLQKSHLAIRGDLRQVLDQLVIQLEHAT